MADITRTKAQVGAVRPEESEIIPVIAAEAIEAGQPVYFASATGRATLADASAAGTATVRGLALNDAGAGQAVDVIKRGPMYGFTLSGNYDAAVYLSDTEGELADAAGTVSKQVGRILAMPDKSATKVLYVDVSWA